MAKPKADFDGKELLAGIESALRANDGQGLSVAEIRKECGHSQNWVRNRLAELKAQGRLVVNRRTNEGIDGRATLVPVYSIRK